MPFAPQAVLNSDIGNDFCQSVCVCAHVICTYDFIAATGCIHDETHRVVDYKDTIWQILRISQKQMDVPLLFVVQGIAFRLTMQEIKVRASGSLKAHRFASANGFAFVHCNGFSKTFNKFVRHVGANTTDTAISTEEPSGSSLICPKDLLILSY